jgi:hypothetical protein
MLRRILTGVVLTITSSLAIPVALDSVSAPAGGSPPVSLADVVSASPFSSTLTYPASGCGLSSPQEFDASYAGSSNVGSVALHIAGCFVSSSELAFSGSFTITTNVGTLSGTASGPENWSGASHMLLFVQLAMSVQSGTGSFAGTTGYLQFETYSGYPFSSGFLGTVSVAVPTTTIALPSNGATVSGSTVLDASATNATSVEFRLFGGIYGYSAPVLCVAKLSLYGWVCLWNSVTVPNGSYALVAQASNSTATAFSPNVNITVKNPPGQHRKATA